MASVERWSVRTLRERIDSMLYERTALSRKPDALIAEELAKMLELDKSGIHVAEYLTTLPPPAMLVERLQQATHRAQSRIGH